MSNERQDPSCSSKRQRLEILAPPPPAPQNNNELLLLLDLPLLAQHIISFLHHPDRLNLAETCHLAKKQVDVYCEKVLEKITGPHNNRNVDGTFHQRIRDQTSIVTKRTKPVHLPPRYLLWVALRKEPLYKIQLYEGSNDTEVHEVVLSTSQNCLLVVPVLRIGQNHMYNLQTRQILPTLVVSGFTFGQVFLDDTRVIAHSRDEICLWSRQGDGDENRNWAARSLYQVEANAKILGCCFRVDQHHVLFATTAIDLSDDPRLFFRKLDTRSTNVETILTIYSLDENFVGGFISQMTIAGIVNQKWLLFLFAGTAGTGDFLSRLYVYNLQTKTKTSVWRGDGHYYSVHQSFTSPGTFCAVECYGIGDPHRASILKLDPAYGQLSELSSFPLSGTPRILGFSESHVPRIFGFSESHVFVTGYGSNAWARGKVEAFNMETGRREWWIDLRFPSDQIEIAGGVANARNEVIVVISHEDEEECNINAFCLEEPQL